MMLKLKFQYFGHLMWRVTHWKRLWCWEGLGAGGEWETEDEMAGWHHRLNGHEFGWTSGVGDEQGGLACCNSRGRNELDTTERLNWTELNWSFSLQLKGYSNPYRIWNNCDPWQVPEHVLFNSASLPHSLSPFTSFFPSGVNSCISVMAWYWNVVFIFSYFERVIIKSFLFLTDV